MAAVALCLLPVADTTSSDISHDLEDLAVRIPELQPLVEKATLIQNDSKVRDIYEYILDQVEKAKTSSMAQSACERIVTMTHPKVWGDRDAEFGTSCLDWFKYLDELNSVANECGRAIFERYPRDQNG